MRTIKFMHHNSPVEIKFGAYRHPRNPCLMVSYSWGGPCGVLTTNVAGYTCEEGEYLIKTWEENADLAKSALESGFFEDTGKKVATGFCQASVWKIKNLPAQVKGLENSLESFESKLKLIRDGFENIEFKDDIKDFIGVNMKPEDLDRIKAMEKKRYEASFKIARQKKADSIMDAIRAICESHGASLSGGNELKLVVDSDIFSYPNI